ncbi:GTPase IMAP family member 6-like isoform X1 [Xyrauchen texanus]|uniref:GTPase IMAP family member 6-like isoform X1 n=1 Tax=Xyrauchen texanus TaxID=154827 RepID=UPI002241B0D6|nr:GTPase IMAP family member 6-like isoform X1 [Xyrauchen texanus]
MATEKGMKEHLRLVLIGLQGVGKSAAGNTIFGRDEFLSDVSATSLTLKSEMRDADVCGRRVTVVDTPGLINSEQSIIEVEEELKRALSLCEPGPHAFLLVIQLGRFTEQERQVMETLQKMLCSNVNMFTIVLFTYGDKLKNKSLDQFVREDMNLQKLIQQCGSQYHVFNNTDRENTCQVSELFEKVDSQLRKRSKQPYYVRKASEQRSRWKPQLFYIAAASVAVLLLCAALLKTQRQGTNGPPAIVFPVLSTESVQSDKTVTNVDKIATDEQTSETLWEIVQSVFKKENRAQFCLVGLVSLLIARKLIK